MALLVKEQRALSQLEAAFCFYYEKVLGIDLVIDSSKTPEERLLFLATELQTAV